MSDVFHWNMQLPRAKTYAGRAEECRQLAKLGPGRLRKSFLELAAEYDQLAKQAGE